MNLHIFRIHRMLYLHNIPDNKHAINVILYLRQPVDQLHNKIFKILQKFSSVYFIYLKSYQKSQQRTIMKYIGVTKTNNIYIRSNNYVMVMVYECGNRRKRSPVILIATCVTIFKKPLTCKKTLQGLYCQQRDTTI